MSSTKATPTKPNFAHGPALLRAALDRAVIDFNKDNALIARQKSTNQATLVLEPPARPPQEIKITLLPCSDTL